MHHAPKLTYISNKKQDYLLHYVLEDNLYSISFSKENISGSNVNYSYTLVYLSANVSLQISMKHLKKK